MWKRLIEPSIEKSREVLKLIKYATNKTEIRRINLVSAYLRLWSIAEVKKILWSGTDSILASIKKYKEDPKGFYKTKYPWKKQSEEWRNIEDKINKIIEERSEKWLQTDIETVREIFNRRYKNIKILNYTQAWQVVRKRLKLPYQKPYITDSRKPKDAEEILKSRIKEWLGEVEKLEKQELKDKRLQNKKI